MNGLNEGHQLLLARALVATGAVLVRPDKPFTFSSGWESPVKVEIPRAFGQAKFRQQVLELIEVQAADLLGINTLANRSSYIVAAVATGGVCLGISIANILKFDFCEVRKPPVNGEQWTIEGSSVAGKTVLVVEDMATTGLSSCAVAIVVRNAGGIVRTIFSLASYDQAIAQMGFSALQVSFSRMLSFAAIRRAMGESGTYSPLDLQVVDAWYEDPAAWGETQAALPGLLPA